MKYGAFVLFVAVALALAIGRQAAPVAEEEPSVISRDGELASNAPVRIAPGPRKTTPKMVDVDFSKKLEKTLNDLPRRESVREMTPEEVHHTPRAVVDAGIALGDIAMRLKDDPALVAQGIVFYERCALDESILTSVRAVCLRNLKRWEPRTDLSRFPDWLQAIAERLPPS